jgi:hypothetical protein
VVPSPELAVGAPVALVAYLDALEKGLEKDGEKDGDNDDGRAARAVAAVDSERERMKRSWFGESARAAVQVMLRRTRSVCT